MDHSVEGYCGGDYEMPEVPDLPEMPLLAAKGVGSPLTSFDSDDGSVASQGSPELPKVGGGKRPAVALRGISEPGKHDCVSGRGGGTNYHPGNLRFRKMVEDRKPAYKAANRGRKPELALQLVRDWRALDPPGRFLKLNDDTKKYDDIGDEEARAKCSQALREKRCSTLVASPGKYNSLVETAPAANASGGVPALPQPNGNALHDADVALAMKQLTGGDGRLSKLAEASSTVPPLMVSMQAGSGKLTVAPGSSNPSSTLAQCLSIIGITDLSLLSGTLELEFQAIKASYFQTILRVHPDGSSPRTSDNGAAFRCARAAFEVLRALLHKLRMQRSSFRNLALTAEGNADYVRDCFEEQINLVSRSATSPSYNHYTIASKQEHPLIQLGVSGGLCQCAKCNQPVSTGGLCVGSLSDGQWRHLTCWSVPLDVWSGLSQQLDPSVSLRDTASMDEVFIRGFASLDYASQLEFASHLRRRENWVLTRANPSPSGQNVPAIQRPAAAVGSESEPHDRFGAAGADQSGCKHSIAEESAKDLRPLKKRAVSGETPKMTALV